MLMVAISLFTCARNGGCLVVEAKSIELVVLEGCVRLGDKPIESIVLGAKINQNFKRNGTFPRSVGS